MRRVSKLGLVALHSLLQKVTRTPLNYRKPVPLTLAFNLFLIIGLPSVAIGWIILSNWLVAPIYSFLFHSLSDII